jgi:hypothetical protein
VHRFAFWILYSGFWILDSRVVYFLARFLQLVGMSLLAASILADYGLGPSPRLFVAGIAVFASGWAITRILRRS